MKTVRLLLEMNGLTPDSAALDIVTALAAYAGSDDPVDASSPVLQKLRKGLPADLSETKMQAIFIEASPDVVARYYSALITGMQRGEMKTALRQAHFLAQIAHESNDLRYSEELTGGEKYEDRKDLGNTQPGDGPRFKGRGLIQITGRSNYKRLGTFVGRDLLTGDGMKAVASDPLLAVDSAIWYWGLKSLNDLADRDDVVAVTRRINGGLNDRRERLTRAKFFLLPPQPSPVKKLHAVAELPRMSHRNRPPRGKGKRVRL